MVTVWSFPVALLQSPLGRMTPLQDFPRLQSFKHLQWSLLCGHLKLWLSLMTLQKIRQANRTIKTSLWEYMPFSFWCQSSSPRMNWLAHHKPVSCTCFRAHTYGFPVLAVETLWDFSVDFMILSCPAWHDTEYVPHGDAGNSWLGLECSHYTCLWGSRDARHCGPNLGVCAWWQGWWVSFLSLWLVTACQCNHWTTSFTFPTEYAKVP